MAAGDTEGDGAERDLDARGRSSAPVGSGPNDQYRIKRVKE